MRSFIVTSLICAALSAVSGHLNLSYAQQPVVNLGEVVVSAPEEGVEAVGSVYTVSSEEISARGARTLDQALELLPGISIRTANAGSPRIDIRGLRTRHVQLLLNGIPINSTFDGQFDPSTFGVENIEMIKVTMGGGSVLYGEGGNGGVINIVTKNGMPGLSGSIGAEAAENDAYLGRFSLSGAADQVDAFVSGSFYDRDSYPLSDDFEATAEQDGGDRANSDRERKNLFAAMTYAPSDDTRIGVNLQYRKDQYGIPAVTNYDSNDPVSKRPKYDRVDDLEGFATQIAFDRRFSERFSSRGWVYFNLLDTLENRYDDDTYSSQDDRGALRTDSTTTNSGLNLQFAGNWRDKGTTTLALMAENSDWSAEGFEITRSGTESYDLQRDLQLYSLALQHELALLEDLGAVIGVGGHLQRQDDGGTEDALSYQLGLHYDLVPGTRLRASHSRKVRFPSIRQLYDVGSGNEDLTAERTLNYELGIEQQLPAETSVVLTGFVTDAKDFIEKRDATDRYENFEHYRFKGLELALENRMFERAFIRATYSLLFSENRNVDNSRDELQYRPRDKATLEGQYRFSFGLTVNASLLYVARQYVYDSDWTEKVKLNDYTLVNLKLKQAFLSEQLEIYVGADNLFDEDYEQSYGLPQAGRTLYAGMNYRF